MSQLLKARLRCSFAAEIESQQQQLQSSQAQCQQQQQLPVFSPSSASSHLSPISIDYLTLLRSISLSAAASQPPWRQRLENFLWTASATFIIYYGDFRSNLLLILFADTRIRRFSFNMGLLCIMLNISILIYIALRLRSARKAEEKLEIVAPGAVPVATIIGLAAYILFSHALWPIWKVLTLPMLFTLFMAMVVVAPYLTPYLNMKLDVDTLRGLYVRSAE